MPYYNNITIVGHAGRDAEIKQAGDRSVIRFSVAWNNRKKETTWFNVSYFITPAQEWIAERIKKGSVVLVSGSAELYAPEGKQASISILARDVHPFGGKSDTAAQEDDGVPF